MSDHLSEEKKEEIIDSLDYTHFLGLNSELKPLFSSKDINELKGLSNSLLFKLGNIGLLLKLYLPKRNPAQQQRVKSFWLMLVSFGLWTIWKLSGCVVVSPMLCVLGFFVGICFFVMSYQLLIGDKRLMKKLIEKLEKESLEETKGVKK